MALTELRHLSPEAMETLDRFLEAAEAAEEAAGAAIEVGDPEMDRCIAVCRDAADLALLNARFMVRGSGVQAPLSGICADACEIGAEECSRFEDDAAQRAEPVLRECARRAREMAGGEWRPEDEGSDEDASPWSGYF